MCYSGNTRSNDFPLELPLNEVNATLCDLPKFKAVINDSVGQEARLVIKRTIQKIDPEWLITLLTKMMVKRSKGVKNAWCAFESAFAEPPFNVFDMQVGQVAMLYHTVKDHLNRHCPPLSIRSTGSLWDHVPEPKASEQQTNREYLCLECGQPIQKVHEQRCMRCLEKPFHKGCLESHLTTCYSSQRSPQTEEEIDPVSAEMKQEESIPVHEGEDTSSQWVKQMMEASVAPMPFKQKVANFAIALSAIMLAAWASYSPADVDSPVPNLQ